MSQPPSRPAARRIALILTVLLLGAAAVGWWRHQPAPKAAARDAVLRCEIPAQAAGSPHPGMVWVPPGNLAYGDDVYPEESPVQTIRVGGFWIDRTEVTNAQFAEFVQATGYVTVAERPVDTQKYPGLLPDMQRPGAVVFMPPQKMDGSANPAQWWRYIPGASWRHPGGPGTSIEGREAFPVVAVTGADAAAYAKWKGHSLPHEAQWEWAARAAREGALPTHEQPAAANTWQGPFPMVNSGEDGFTGLAPAGCYAPNALGAYDMIGNAWELTADAWTDDHRAAQNHDAIPPTHQGAARRVIKGGSFLCAPNYCMRYRAGSRQPQEDDLATSHLGFRTILEAPGP